VSDGELVVDLWAAADAAKTTPWERDTIINVLVQHEDDDIPELFHPR
jgi:hypothetical protein